jgi:hypothetical protein
MKAAVVIIKSITGTKVGYLALLSVAVSVGVIMQDLVASLMRLF